ncbi:hypothetical protein LM599_03645 [Candidatus Acetothermia bacterium]|nr:hypothetical protein [Candidatus Acetothermia bacterium]MCI2426990.1 hypothetical protein [Candidatus Acetothermia bacterium]MCI2428432.1 hypothetical protein [Candidatus Acetothermia bacterium]
MKRRTLVILAALVASFAIPICAATSVSVDVQVSWTILPFQSLTLAGSNSWGEEVTVRVDFPQPTAADLSVGFIEIRGALSLVARSNIPWVVKVRAMESDLGTSYDGTFTKPLHNFLLRANSGHYFTLANYDQIIIEGQPGVHPITIDYKILFDQVTHRAGNYGVTLVYTITTR